MIVVAVEMMSAHSLLQLNAGRVSLVWTMEQERLKNANIKGERSPSVAMYSGSFSFQYRSR